MMKRKLVTTSFIEAWILFVIAFFIAEEWLKRPPVQHGNLKSIENHLIRKLTKSAVEKRLGCAAMILTQNGNIKAEYGFGIANSERNLPTETDKTLFFLASVSKTFTSWGVMKLVEDGKFGLDEPVIQYLKRWISRKWSV